MFNWAVWYLKEKLLFTFRQGFWYFARSWSREIQVNPRNPAKFTKTRKISQNSVEILSNQCLYSNFETCLSYWGYLLAVNSQIYVKTSSLKRANNVPKLPGVDYVAKNWALAMMLKALPLVHFWSVVLLKEQMMTSARKTLKTLVWSAQSRLIPSKICLENNHKIGHFLLPRNYREIGRFFREFVPTNPAKFDVFFRDLTEALFRGFNLYSFKTRIIALIIIIYLYLLFDMRSTFPDRDCPTFTNNGLRRRHRT